MVQLMLVLNDADVGSPIIMASEDSQNQGQHPASTTLTENHVMSGMLGNISAMAISFVHTCFCS